MILAAVGDTPYNIVLLLHILTAFAAFAPAFVHPFIGAQSRELDGAGRSAVFGWISSNARRIYAPALILTGLFGFALPGMSDDVLSLGDGWLLTAIIIWVAMNGILHAVVIPAEKAMAGGDTSVEGRISAGGAVLTVLLVVMLYLMVFKPGA